LGLGLPKFEKENPTDPGIESTAVSQADSGQGETQSWWKVNFPMRESMTRIEIQTSDPTIRIIWFAPKETESHQNKPATD
jgi:hypothetical protein